MASRETAPRRPVPRLYLVTPPIVEPAGIRDALVAALAAGDVAAVLVQLAAADGRTLINRTKALAPLIQDRGAALILDSHPTIVARAGADGAHARDLGDFEAARALKPERIVGCGGLVSRHDAMLAGDAGADYVMFGEP